MMEARARSSSSRSTRMSLYAALLVVVVAFSGVAHVSARKIFPGPGGTPKPGANGGGGGAAVVEPEATFAAMEDASNDHHVGEDTEHNVYGEGEVRPRVQAESSVSLTVTVTRGVAHLIGHTTSQPTLESAWFGFNPCTLKCDLLVSKLASNSTCTAKDRTTGATTTTGTATSTSRSGWRSSFL
jgi:hypothetical protein